MDVSTSEINLPLAKLIIFVFQTLPYVILIANRRVILHKSFKTSIYVSLDVIPKFITPAIYLYYEWLGSLSDKMQPFSRYILQTTL